MDVYVVIAAGHRHRLPDVGKRGKMHDSIDLLGAKYRIKRRGVANIALDQSAPAYEFAMPERQIVKHDDVVPFCSESLGAMATDVTGTSGD